MIQFGEFMVFYCYCTPFTDWITYLTELNYSFTNGCWVAVGNTGDSTLDELRICVHCFMTTEEFTSTSIFQKTIDQRAIRAQVFNSLLNPLYNKCSPTHADTLLCTRVHQCKNKTVCMHTHGRGRQIQPNM